MCGIDADISAELERDLAEWGRENGYRGWDHDGGATWQPPTPDREDWALRVDWVRRGKDLADRLQRELGEGYEVVYDERIPTDR